MEAALFVAIFGAMFFAVNSSKRRAAESFSALSVITGGEVLLRRPASSDAEDRALARYRKSPASRLLILND